MSYGAFGGYVSTFGKGAVGGTTPVRGSSVLESVGNIMAFPFKDDLLDKSGNHTIDYGTSVLGTSYGIGSTSGSYTYDGENMLLLDNVASSAPRVIASTQAHQIPHNKPVSFGCFVMGSSYFFTLQTMNSGPGGNRANYGLQLHTTAGWRYVGFATTDLGDFSELTTSGRWFHIAMVVDSTSRGTGSNPAEFYINGQPVWSGDVGNSQTVLSTNNFAFACEADETVPDWDGFISNAFVSDNVLDRATIKALSDESFGHASPYVPTIP
jgi:hypothetical protein